MSGLFPQYVHSFNRVAFGVEVHASAGVALDCVAWCGRRLCCVKQCIVAKRTPLESPRTHRHTPSSAVCRANPQAASSAAACLPFFCACSGEAAKTRQSCTRACPRKPTGTHIAHTRCPPPPALRCAALGCAQTYSARAHGSRRLQLAREHRALNAASTQEESCGSLRWARCLQAARSEASVSTGSWSGSRRAALPSTPTCVALCRPWDSRARCAEVRAACCRAFTPSSAR